jgi:hypothetical protein
VDEVEVEVVQAQPLQAGVAGRLARSDSLVGIGQLGGDEQLPEAAIARPTAASLPYTEAVSINR